MTIQETGEIMDILVTAYPLFYKNQNEDERYTASKLWAVMFADDDFALVAAAVKAFIATDEKGYPPLIGTIKAKLRQITFPQEMTEMEAWQLVRKAISNGTYGSKHEYGKLPLVIQRILGSHNTLREWALVSIDSVETVIQSNFMRSYRAKVQNDREYAALPPSVKALAESMSEKLALPKQEHLAESEWNSRRNELVDKLETHEADRL